MQLRGHAGLGLLIAIALAAGPSAARPSGAAAGDGAAGALFSSYRPITLQLSAPFRKLFDNAREENDYTVAGHLSYTDDNGRSIDVGDVKISLRGHTSRRESECAFPKLKLQFTSAPEDPIFRGFSTVKVGTHCDDRQDGLTARFGRLANEASPWREAFVYRLLDTLGVPTLKARPVRIAYVTTDEPGDQSTTGDSEPLVRNAMLLEDDADAKRRLNATHVIDESEFTNAADRLTPEDTARVEFAEALIGNFDWCLKVTAEDRYRCDGRHPLWNILALEHDGRVTPLIYDFDVSGMVTGRHPWFADVYNEAFLPSKSHAAIEVLGQIQRTRSLFPRPLLDATRQQFLQRRGDAYRALGDGTLDARGRDRIREYLDGFYEAIGSDESFYRPVVAARDAVAYADAQRTRGACGARSTIPIGTPVSDPLETRGSMLRVVVLDAMWRWAPPNACRAIHDGTVWVDSAAVTTKYP